MAAYILSRSPALTTVVSSLRGEKCPTTLQCPKCLNRLAHVRGYRLLNGLTHWLGDMQVGNATPFSMVLPLNSLLTALHINRKFLTASVHSQ